MRKKGLSEAVVKRYLNLYQDNYSVVVVNGIIGRCFKNIRLSVRQGDKFAMEVFTFGMDPILIYLEKRLQGIPIHHLPVHGPVQAHPTPPLPPPAPLPPLPGLAPLPPPPAVHRCFLQAAQPAHVLPPLKTVYKLKAYCDDLKPAITSMYEFKLVERIMTIFEQSSGCKMHRTTESQKCKFLPLSKWKGSLKQEDIPFDFFTLSDHLDFLGVTLMATPAATRKSNGDHLQDRVRKTIGPWRAGRFMSLNLRPHSVNCYALSKLLYRFNIIDPRVSDINFFTSQVKSYIYADLLEKPEERILYREIKDGGLGLYHIQCRATAALISTFLQTAVNPTFQRNHYHNALYRQKVLGESFLPTPPTPTFFRGEFFPILREMKRDIGDIENLPYKAIYNFLLQRELCQEQETDGAVRKLWPLKCEQAAPNVDWGTTWRLARLKGLGPDLTSFLLSLTWGILPCRARVSKFKPHVSPECQLCDANTPETLEHAFFSCTGNQSVPLKLMGLLRTYVPGIEVHQVLKLDLNLDNPLELPLVWLVASLLQLLWQQRQEGKVCPVKTRAELEARCRLLRSGKGASQQNASTLASIALAAMYA